MKCFPLCINNVNAIPSKKQITIDSIIFTDHNVKAFKGVNLIDSIKFKASSMVEQHIYNYGDATKVIIQSENSCGLGKGWEVNIGNTIEITKFKH